MRFRHVRYLGLFLAVLIVATVRGDGLIRTLPKDGTEVSYALEIVGSMKGQEKTVKGTLTLASVGSETKDGQACRWIELGFIIKDNQREFGDYSKFLIAEKHLRPGNNPLEHVIQAWRRRGPRESTVKKFTNPGNAVQSPLPVFLSGPLNTEKRLPAKDIKSGLGPLKCAGVAGNYKYTNKTGSVTGTVELRHHATSPFGIVIATYDMTIKRGDQTEKFRFLLKLEKTNNKAKSQLTPPKK